MNNEMEVEVLDFSDDFDEWNMNNMEAVPTENVNTPTDSLISYNGRDKLQNDILFVARSKVVQDALRGYIIETGKAKPSFAQCTIAQACYRGKHWLREEFVEGVRAVVEAWGDHRLETSHWILGILWEDRAEVTGMDMVEWFFEEARQHASELENDDAKEITQIFGYT